MKSALLLLAFFGQLGAAPPDIPLADPAADFPLHVHLIAARYGTDTVREYRSIQGEMRGGPGFLVPTGSYHGYGSGNLLGDSVRGFDFAFDCHAAFRENNQPQEFYQARWKKPEQRLELLTQRIGSSHADVCELKVAMKAHPFADPGAAAAWNGSPLSSSNLWVDPDVAFPDPDPDYPVHLHVLTSYRRYSRNSSEGYGSANVVGGSVQGLDFSHTCPHGFLFNTQPEEFYQGYWVKPGQRLEILTQRVGSDRVDRCQINVTLKRAPYPNPVAAPAAGPALVRP